MLSNMKYRPNALSGAALALSRQVWLAGLGAAAVGRDWMQSEAAGTFRTLVREGTVVESRAIRFIGDQVESSMLRANTLWRETRASLRHNVRQAADSAVLLVTQTLPRSLPAIEVRSRGAAPAHPTTPKRVARTKPATARTPATAGAAKTTTKSRRARRA